MVTLIAGVFLWFLGHLFGRILPSLRAKLGMPGKGIMALVLILSIYLMHQGYSSISPIVFWDRHPALVGINNLLVLIAVYLFVASGFKPWISGKIRHLQLSGFKAWAIAHILVNGDSSSFILFGGLLIWSVVQLIIINKQDGKPALPSVSIQPFKEILAVLSTFVVYFIISTVHQGLGYPVFG